MSECVYVDVMLTWEGSAQRSCTSGMNGRGRVFLFFDTNAQVLCVCHVDDVVMTVSDDFARHFRIFGHRVVS